MEETTSSTGPVLSKYIILVGTWSVLTLKNHCLSSATVTTLNSEQLASCGHAQLMYGIIVGAYERTIYRIAVFRIRGHDNGIYTLHIMH